MDDLLSPGHGGKAKGRRSKHTLTLQQITERMLEKEGTLPLEQMLFLIRRQGIIRRDGETEAQFADREYRDMQLRLQAAIAAAPYIHPKVRTEINISGGQDIGANMPVDVRELARDLVFALEIAAREKPIDVTPVALPRQQSTTGAH